LAGPTWARPARTPEPRKRRTERARAWSRDESDS
jgi:hypothetical protein